MVVVVWYVLFHKFPDPLSLQDASSNFLVLRIEAHKITRVSHALWGPEGLRKWLLSYCYRTDLLGGQNTITEWTPLSPLY